MSKMMNPKNVPHAGYDPQEHAYQQSTERVLSQLNSQSEGLSVADAAERLNTYGPNALPEKKGKPAWLRFLAHFNDA